MIPCQTDHAIGKRSRKLYVGLVTLEWYIGKGIQDALRVERIMIYEIYDWVLFENYVLRYNKLLLLDSLLH